MRSKIEQGGISLDQTIHSISDHFYYQWKINDFQIKLQPRPYLSKLDQSQLLIFDDEYCNL